MALYGFIAVIIAIALAFAGSFGYRKGVDSRTPEIARLTAAIETSKQLAADAESRAKIAGERISVKYRDRVKVITERVPAETRLVEVIRRETNPDCTLSGSYRQLWDGTAPAGDTPAGNPSGTIAAPVAVAEAAATAAEARRRFEQNAAQLTAIQDLIGNNNK